MYEYLEGRPSSKTAARLILNVGGVGYDLAVPLGLHFPGTEEPGPKAKLLRVWVHLVVREDAHTLYGFPNLGGRDLFRVLLKVRGVGPSLARAVLSSLPVAEFLVALRDGDRARLQAVKGVGKKTAEQILLDLREKLTAPGAIVPGAEATGATPPTTASGNIEDAVQALTSIGFKENDARKAVKRAAESVDADDLELLVRTALRP
jgi:Holliday junction DNA helicase RuvA